MPSVCRTDEAVGMNEWEKRNETQQREQRRIQLTISSDDGTFHMPKPSAMNKDLY